MKVPPCTPELPAPAVVVENTAEVVVGASEIVILMVCAGAGKKTDLVGDGVLSSSPSSQRLVVVTVTKTVAGASLVLRALVVVIERFGELTRVVATVTGEWDLPKD